MKNKAFTLAEVLITLTIIGVIAALTIPNLMSKYQKHVSLVGLKKAYSILQGAVEMMPMTENCPAGDYDCVGLFTDSLQRTELLAKNIKHKQICLNNTSKECSWAKNFNVPGAYVVFGGALITDDGMYIGGYNYWANTILVDINGGKGPNKSLHDIFAFRITEPNTNEFDGIGVRVVPVGAEYAYPEQHNRGKRWEYSCNEKVLKQQGNSMYNLYCTARILQENKISDFMFQFKEK